MVATIPSLPNFLSGEKPLPPGMSKFPVTYYYHANKAASSCSGDIEVGIPTAYLINITVDGISTGFLVVSLTKYVGSVTT
jgi:hypothetical protein